MVFRYYLCLTLNLLLTAFAVLVWVTEAHTTPDILACVFLANTGFWSFITLRQLKVAVIYGTYAAYLSGANDYKQFRREMETHIQQHDEGMLN